MKSDASDKDPAVPVMAMDILSNVLSRADNPGDLGTCLTEEVRDLTGARCVLLIQCQCTPTGTAHRVVGVNPLRRSEWAESPAGNRLYEVVHRMPAAQLWRGEEPLEVAGLLRQEGFELSMVFPLNTGEFRVGAMLVLGLPDEEHITSVLSLLNNLSAIVALVLRNTILYEKQEQLIQERTAELRDNNEKLTMELTERKRVEEALYEAQQVYRALIENSPDIIARYDRDCRRTYVNPTYLRVAQIPQQELLATAPIQRSPLPADSAAVLQNLLRRVIDSGVAEAVDVKWPKADNIDYWYNIYAFPEFDREGLVTSVMAVSRDITGRKRAEEALNRLNEELEQRVRERTAELAAKNAELERMNRIFVGRELRMVELKDRIRELEKAANRA